jgi:hypothetical protein
MKATALSLGISRIAIASSLVILKQPPAMAMQGIQVDSLRLTMILVAIASLGMALSLSHIDPVRGLIADALKPALIYKSLGQIQGMTITAVPILA